MKRRYTYPKPDWLKEELKRLSVVFSNGEEAHLSNVVALTPFSFLDELSWSENRFIAQLNGGSVKVLQIKENNPEAARYRLYNAKERYDDLDAVLAEGLTDMHIVACRLNFGDLKQIQCRCSGHYHNGVITFDPQIGPDKGKDFHIDLPDVETRSTYEFRFLFDYKQPWIFFEDHEIKRFQLEFAPTLNFSLGTFNRVAVGGEIRLRPDPDNKKRHDYLYKRLVLSEGKAEFFHDILIYRSNAYFFGIEEWVKIAEAERFGCDYQAYGTTYKAKTGTSSSRSESDICYSRPGNSPLTPKTSSPFRSLALTHTSSAGKRLRTSKSASTTNYGPMGVTWDRRSIRAGLS